MAQAIGYQAGGLLEWVGAQLLKPGACRDARSGNWLTSCETDVAGVCRVEATPSMPIEEAVAVQFSVDGVLVGDQYVLRPRPLLFRSAALDDLVVALSSNEGLEQAAFGIAWEEGFDSDLGEVVAGYSLVDTSSGVSSRPSAIVLNVAALGGAPIGDVITIGESGVPLSLMHIGGTGLASLPVGFSRTMAFLGGTGLASLPVGIRPRHLYINGSGDNAVWVDSPAGAHGAPDASPLRVALDSGSFSVAGYPAATFAVGMGHSVSPFAAGSSTLGEPVEVEAEE